MKESEYYSKIKQLQAIPVLESVSEDLGTVGVDGVCSPGSNKISKASVGAMRSPHDYELHSV